MKKIEIRKNCKLCKTPLGYRQRTFCSTKCRNAVTYKRYKKYQAQWQKDYKNKKASIESPDKCQCLICDRWYKQVGSHVAQIHKMTCRKYREKFKLEVKRGIVVDNYRKLKGDLALANGTWKNLKKGKKFWYKKNQKGVGVYERSPITIERLKTQFLNTPSGDKYKKRISKRRKHV